MGVSAWAKMREPSMMKSSQLDEPIASGLLPVPPHRISVIIPTKNGTALLSRCIKSIRDKSTYPDYEIIVVDNGSTDPKALRLLDGLCWSAQTKVLKYPGRFNFSAMINRGAAEASGSILCLLNNDTEVISPDWMETMAGQLLQEGVGVVGALLLFPDGSIQHAGDVVGGYACVRHDHGEGWMQSGSKGSGAFLPEHREVDAVTGACLMTRRNLFLKLGGMDERTFSVAFNDADYCLRVREASGRVICDSRARLYHHELATRGRTWKPRDLWRLHQEKKAFRKRWLDKRLLDPFTTIPSSQK
jgi:GT2 family glycosyltransferase